MAQIYTNTTKRTLNLGGVINVKPGQFRVDGKLARRLKKSALFASYVSDLSIVEGAPKPEKVTAMKQARAEKLAQDKAAAEANGGKTKADMKAAPSDGKTKLTAEKPKAEGNAP